MPKILLIEDNEANRDLISRYLELFDYQVSVANDGLEGLEKAHANRPDIDVVLMDMNLPDVDGWEVARRLKADEATKTLPLIALTAHAMVGDRQRALDAGCDEYASKPIDFNDLFSKIESLYQRTTAS